MKKRTRLLSLLGTSLIVITSLGFFWNNDNKLFEISKNIELFANLYKEINTYYVDEIEPSKFMKIGLDAMVSSLDPYTNYISEAQIEDFRFSQEGKYHGIGIESRKMGDYFTVTELFKDQPADKAGLKVGDQIIAIDGKDAKGKSEEDIEEILRGFPGTEVVLQIRRPGKEDNFQVKIIREDVEVENVPHHDLIAENIGYITLTTFTRDAGSNVANALKDLKDKNPNLKGVVFDLRGNGGGLLLEAVNVTNVFIPKNELVTTTKGRVKDWDRSFRTLNNPVDTEIPVVVLINNRSASASEIVAGAIQDYDRGVLIGQRSFGKGLVQNTRNISDNAKVKMTTAKYYIPSGRCIQAVEYENGEPVDIPDEQRTPFKTRNGRQVFDGGGISPDLVVDRDGSSNLLKQLERGNIIFDYVTQYCADKASVGELMSLKFNDFKGFIDFVEARNFKYDTKTEQLLKELQTQAEKDGYAIAATIANLKQEMVNTKRAELLKYEDAITDIIEKEMAGRYFYQEGAVKIGLRNDIEIREAIRLLNDSTAYNELLK
ncbi:MAG: S41 family peptidase [Saprospiraceae bacterium]|nr:S41 family peptidase [Saprospiraceae bacterium]